MLKDRRPIVGLGKRREQVVWNLLPGEVPDHGAEFVLFVKTNPVIDGKKFDRRFVFEENVTAFAVGIVDEQVEENDGAKYFLVFEA